LINYHQTIILLKQSPVAHQIHFPAGRCTSIHNTQCTELSNVKILSQRTNGLQICRI